VRSRFSAAIAFLLALLATRAPAAGLYQDGAGSRAQAMGGTGTAAGNDPASALFDDPAALSDLTKLMLQLGIDGAAAQGAFHDHSNRDSTMSVAGVTGDAAAVIPAGPVRFAIGINPDIAARTDWRYRDAPGGADGLTSYGVRPDRSEIALLRSAAGISWQALPGLSVGGNIGLLYNENVLETLYVFQRQPVLRTVKTLLKLNTDGYGWNGELGLRCRPISTVALSLAYTSESEIKTHGTATGNAGVQLARLGLGAARPNFKYDAEVDNVFPQQLSAGVAWNPRPSLTLAAQLDWINWASAFTSLPVHLTRGTDPDLNGLVGSNRLNDQIPLHWRDQFVGRLGAEQAFAGHWSVRAGYSYGNDPVPPGTLTPLTAAIFEHTLTGGLGYQTGWLRLDASCQWALPAAGHVQRSSLASGEYDASSTEVSAERFGLSAIVSY
jgi:long-chain fatty acid transport protein